jgi:pseudouridine-5'-phosphate glycosidase
MESEVRAGGAVPATIAVEAGQVLVGTPPASLERLAQGGEGFHKISSREYGPAVAHGWSGGTTVAGTLNAAALAGIRVFATGGIGGVHRPAGFDISADLPQLARSPVVVVCAGAKAILDLSATLEYLETVAVPVVGYGTDEFPAFYSRESGLRTSARADRPGEVAAIARAHWQMGQPGAVLVTVPIPTAEALPREEIEQVIQEALQDANEAGIQGQEVTPFLLSRVSELTHAASLRANLALLKNNARVAAAIAVALAATI